MEGDGRTGRSEDGEAGQEERTGRSEADENSDENVGRSCDGEGRTGRSELKYENIS